MKTPPETLFVEAIISTIIILILFVCFEIYSTAASRVVDTGQPIVVELRFEGEVIEF